MFVGYLAQQYHLPTLVWKPQKGYLANSVDPDQMPLNAASDQGLHCLHHMQEFL